MADDSTPADLSELRSAVEKGEPVYRPDVRKCLREIARLTAALSDRDEAARLNAEEHLETLRQLADEREDHNRATEGLGRAVIELREAAEAREKAEQTARAYQQTLEERTAERDQARAVIAAHHEYMCASCGDRFDNIEPLFAHIEGCEKHPMRDLDQRNIRLAREIDELRIQLAAARPKAGEVFVRAELRAGRYGGLDHVEPGVEIALPSLSPLLVRDSTWVPRSAIVSPPPEAEGARVDGGAAKGCE